MLRSGAWRVILTGGIFLVGCSDQASQFVAPGEPSPHAVFRTAPEPPPLRQKPFRDRKDTPWRRMTAEEFANAVQAARGEVMIGLKDAEHAEGVDNTGRVVASPGGVVAGKAALLALGVVPDYEFTRTPVITAKVSPELAVSLRNHPMVDYIEPALPGEWLGASGGSSQATPWGVTRVVAPAAWSLATGEDIALLILDSGIDPEPGDLDVAFEWRCGDGTAYDNDDVGHGTAVAGVAAAVNNSVGVVGVAHGVNLFSSNVHLEGGPSVVKTACALEMARAYGVHVVNMSLAFGSPYTTLTDQINGAHNVDDMIIVAAAGNTSGGSVTYPATLANVIAVTATDDANARWSGAAIGSEIDLAAPGVNVLTTRMPSSEICTNHVGLTVTCTGTSYAAPHVAGAAALMRARYPTWTNSQIRARLLATATDLGSTGFDTHFGYGLLNVNAALRMTVTILGPVVADSGVLETWYSSVVGGQTPYTYQWHVDGSPAGTGAELQYTPGGEDFTLSLSVTDDYGLWVADGLNVTVTTNPCDPWCTFRSGPLPSGPGDNRARRSTLALPVH